MRSHIAALCLLALAGCTTPNESSTRPETNTSRGLGIAMVSQNTKDLGTLKQGDVVGTKFTLRNMGQGPIVITHVNTGCACTEARYERKPISVQDEVTIELIFDSKGLHGYQYKTATVMLSGCEQDNVKLAITANIE